ncbi:hypothetical protein PVL29_014049 [Vitis rotundifolia]|uniref:Survival protein SurE-like phosphatase/nucleotidase domain-containing protein n=1 Tax=Vitis rotundifolia TaxID=103349 RepID=A0AA38ZFT8_VITRO|nr:hypothetical protein PVL29_014049 [Vitis rotundifolia]
MLAQSCHVNKQPVQEPNRTAQPKPEISGAHCEYFHLYPFSVLLEQAILPSSSFSSLLFSSFSSFSLLVKKKSMEPASLISNLQQVLITKREDGNRISSCSSSVDESAVKDCSRAVVLVTNGDGIESPGLTSLVQTLLREPRFHVHVCAPQSDKSVSGHSMTVQETLTACSAEIGGATAYEVSGTPADCVSLALSGALFSWSKPVLVICGINKGSSYGLNMFHSGAVAGAREALLCGVPALCISLNWKEDVSCDNDFKDAVNVCLPIIHAAIRDIEKGIFPKSCLVNIEIPSSPLKNKGFKVARQSLRRPALIWQAVSANKHPSIGHFMSNQQSLGFKLAQLGRDASAVHSLLNGHPIPSLDLAGCSTALELRPKESGD